MSTSYAAYAEFRGIGLSLPVPYGPYSTAQSTSISKTRVNALKAGEGQEGAAANAALAE